VKDKNGGGTDPFKIFYPPTWSQSSGNHKLNLHQRKNFLSDIAEENREKQA
jgi:hypothetical protein